jgi:hypothetical protein
MARGGFRQGLPAVTDWVAPNSVTPFGESGKDTLLVWAQISDLRRRALVKSDKSAEAPITDDFSALSTGGFLRPCVHRLGIAFINRILASAWF